LRLDELTAQAAISSGVDATLAPYEPGACLIAIPGKP
jgi:hypothetical protein